MKQLWSNSTVMWDELEIIKRESLIREIPIIINDAWYGLNPAVHMRRCETPCLVPGKELKSHIENKFQLMKLHKEGKIEFIDNDVYLRPETTSGTYEYLRALFPQSTHLNKRFPYCLWQAGISFRDEENSEGMRASKLRLRQFWQLEFQLFTSPGTMAPYLTVALDSLIANYGGESIRIDDIDLPHYSEMTLDWEIKGIEVASLSCRKDWQYGKVFEVAIGLDRLISLL